MALEPISPRKRTLFYCAGFVLIYVVLELVCSTVALVHNEIARDVSGPFWVYEESWNTFHFDPVRGYRLTTTPSRFARIAAGDVEYVGTYRGNAQGFPDADDFVPTKPAGIARRFVVFGDSFTAGQYLESNWPDVLEESVGDWQFLNLSTDGGGLANWWSNLTGIVDQEGYEFDAAIFAVFAGDLRRRFSIAEHRGFDRHMFGRVPGWDPTEFPQTLEQARQYLRPMDGYIVSSERFETVLRERRLNWPRPPIPFHRYPWIAYNVFHLLRGALSGADATRESQAEPVFEPGQLALIDAIRDSLQTRQVPAIVVHIPTREDLLEPPDVDGDLLQARQFADRLGARFVDGNEAFEGLTPAQVRDLWMPHDGHWAQGGSDRFGRFVLGVLEEGALLR